MHCFCTLWISCLSTVQIIGRNVAKYTEYSLFHFSVQQRDRRFVYRLSVMHGQSAKGCHRSLSCGNDNNMFETWTKAPTMHTCRHCVAWTHCLRRQRMSVCNATLNWSPNPRIKSTRRHGRQGISRESVSGWVGWRMGGERTPPHRPARLRHALWRRPPAAEWRLSCSVCRPRHVLHGV